MTQINIQPGHIARHTPKGAGAQGHEAAVIDVAQDLLLQHLQNTGALDCLAEKIARLNRTTMARDMYDLAWVARTPAIFRSLDIALIRRLAVLKIWVDTNGMHAGAMPWNPGHEGSVFDPEHWLRERDSREFDLENIGALSVPVPTARELCATVRTSFAFLSELDEDECRLAKSDARDRAQVIRLLENLPGNRLKGSGLY